jgi:alpha-amylase
MKKYLLLLIAFLLILHPAVNTVGKAGTKPKAGDEIIYHIFERSFFDSDGDFHGDLNGITQKLTYLQQLGVTAVMLTPLYESPFYHNYFATDFYKIDPCYGTMQDYLRLIKELHHRHMKFYMDMETQYVAEGHAWFKGSFNNPASPYADYIVYTDKTNSKPIPIVGGVTQLQGYDSVTQKLVMVNLNNKAVQDYNYKLFKFWMDPNNDGRFDDGVDGFRLDHMMDNLDNVNVLPHLFDTFWAPLLKKLRKINPQLKIIAEQANWGSLGADYFARAGVDRVFAFRLAYAIRSFNKKQLIEAADSTFAVTPPGRQQIVFIENHDMPRFSFAVKGNPGKLRVGCALNLLLGGVPGIYYGQELGMTGGSASLGPTDANQIPGRQAFEWYKADTGRGMAFWYKQKGPWRDLFNDDKPNDGISLEEEKGDPNSLWNFYRAMIGLRKRNETLIAGAYKTLMNTNYQVFTFLRYYGDKKIIVAVNLTGKGQDAIITIPGITEKSDIKNLYGDIKPVAGTETISASMPPYGIAVWALN